LNKFDSLEVKEIEAIARTMIKNMEIAKTAFFCGCFFKLSINKMKNVAREKTRPSTGLLAPTEGKINRARINVNRKKSFKYFDEKKNRPKSTGNIAIKQAPKALGSLNVELI